MDDSHRRVIAAGARALALVLSLTVAGAAAAWPPAARAGAVLTRTDSGCPDGAKHGSARVLLPGVAAPQRITVTICNSDRDLQPVSGRVKERNAITYVAGTVHRAMNGADFFAVRQLGYRIPPNPEVRYTLPQPAMVPLR